MDGTIRAAITPGLAVLIVLKKDQKSGKLTAGVVKDILTKSATHSRGIKVRLASGDVGRVRQIVGRRRPPSDDTNVIGKQDR